MRRRKRGYPGRPVCLLLGWNGFVTRSVTFSATLPLLSLLTACTVGPDYQTPAVPVPEHWQTPGSVDAPQQPPSNRREPLWIHPKNGGQDCSSSENRGEGDLKNAACDPATTWWQTFHDPLLERLIQQAVEHNLDYRQALDRIGAARAQYSMAVAAGLPTFSGRSSVNRRRNSFGGGVSGGTNSPIGIGGGAGRNISNIFQAGFDAAWELDVFGGIRRGMEAAAANTEAERDNSRAVLVSLLGEVARHYIELRLAQRQMVILQDTQAAAAELLRLTLVRKQAGLESGLAVAQAQTLLANTQAQLPEHALAAQQAIHALGVLLGQAPGALSDALNDSLPGDMPALHAAVTPDLPSTLLLRRPDIGAAERRLAAATAQIGVASADLYPKFNLTAFLGLQNPNLAQFTPVGKSWSMAAAASLPLFNWGRIRANIEAKEAQRDELLHAYQAAVLNALRDVEDALTAQREDEQRRLALEQARQAADTTLQLAVERYRRGLTAFSDVLDAKRGLLEVQNRLAEHQARIATDLVALYKALGGGWQVWEESPHSSSECHYPC
ncbi:MAG: efflux transporter outer membrane subunit [Methylococcaceae bacterium]|nr:MAG: efflux transporter outer membrane subunit [Methylococcaceae bacterium]